MSFLDLGLLNHTTCFPSVDIAHYLLSFVVVNEIANVSQVLSFPPQVTYSVYRGSL